MVVRPQRGALSRRRILAGTVFGLTGASVVACGGAGGQADPRSATGLVPPTPTSAAGAAAQATAGPTATPIQAEAGRGATTINFWNGLTGSDGEGMVRLMQRYAQQNPEVTVKIQMIAWRTFYDKLSNSIVAGSPPEMWIFHSEQVIRYASRGLLKQLDDIVQGKTFSGLTIPINDMGYTLPYAQYGGKLYAVPLDQYTWALMYNKDIVQRAGLDPESPPATTEEFIEWGRRTTEDNNGRHPGDTGFDPNNVKTWGYYHSLQVSMWQGMLAQQGQPPMISGPDARDVNTDSPEAIKALTEMASWRERHQFAPGPSGINVMDGFWAGKVAMTYNGIWNTNAIKAHPEIRTGVGLTPRFFSERKATFSGHQMAIPASLQGKRLEEAYKVIKFISDNGLDWAKEGQTPARKSLLNSPEFQELWPQSVFAQQLPNGVINPPHVRLIELGDQIGPAVDAALDGQRRPEEALKEAAERQRQILARRT
ncbi:MAG TPA: ABC transporter substrate-binding protein [Chloroflexota bacterium]|jgi:ABC-type glycerol-3-phosphate transport system substrate-binding protein|nr:ABC transporter substrate-binding protein [Chloroflexota bacterium]